MQNLLIVLISSCFALPYVYGHGFLASLSINGQNYAGNAPNAKANPSIIRQVDDISPVKGASNPYLNCGLDAQFAANVADANPGDTIAFDWRSGSDGSENWIHNTGPMLTYMTSCGSTACSQYNSSSSKWFKIQQVARTSPGGPWAQAAVSNGATANVQLPSSLAPGNYLIRHEIIALQGAVSVGGAEFYPACAQLKVGGSGTGKPSDDELVLLPGAYSDTDPGIYDPNVYDPSASYTFPGPPIAAFAGGDASGTSSSGDASASGSSAAPGSAGTSTAGSSPPSSSGSSSSSSSSSSQPNPPGGVCKLQRRIAVFPSSSSNAEKRMVDANALKSHRRRHLSGLFRDLTLLVRGS